MNSAFALSTDKQQDIEIEEIKETPLQFIETKGGEVEIDDFLEFYTEKEMELLLRNGDIFKPRNHILKVLK